MDANIGTAAQASGMEKLLTSVINTEVTQVVNSVVGVIKQKDEASREPDSPRCLWWRDQHRGQTSNWERIPRGTLQTRCEGILKT